MLFMRLTELEKTILVSLYALGGSTKHVGAEDLLSKFPLRQRKAVRIYLKELVGKKFIVKLKAEDKYRLDEKAKKEIANIFLKGGVTLRL